MTEQIKRGPGRPPKHERSLEQQQAHGVLRKARAASKGLVNCRDELMQRLTVIDYRLAAQMRVGYESTTPIGLIHLHEAAVQGLLSPDETVNVLRLFDEQKAKTHRARVDGQLTRRQQRKAEITKYVGIQNLIKRLGPHGNLTPNGAATLAREVFSSAHVSNCPSHRTLRRFFEHQKAKLLAT